MFCTFTRSYVVLRSLVLLAALGWTMEQKIREVLVVTMGFLFFRVTRLLFYMIVIAVLLLVFYVFSFFLSPSLSLYS